MDLTKRQTVGFAENEVLELESRLLYDKNDLTEEVLSPPFYSERYSTGN